MYNVRVAKVLFMAKWGCSLGDSTSVSSETLLQGSAFLCHLILKEKWYLHLKWNKLRGKMILNLKGKWIASHSVLSDSCDTHGLSHSPGQNTGVSILSLLQGIFPTQGSNPGLLHCQRFFTSWATREAQEYWSG